MGERMQAEREPAHTGPMPAHTTGRVATRARLGVPALALVLLFALSAGLVFHFLGSQSKGVRTPPGAAPLPANIDLSAIAMVSSDEGWAVGGTTPDPNYTLPIRGTPGPNYRDPVLAHFVHGTWSSVPLPAALRSLSANGISLELNTIAMVSPTEGWAAGGSVLPHPAGVEVDGMTFGIILHYLNGVWSLYSGGSTDTPPFFLIRMRSPSDGWAVAGSMLYRYDGSAWRQVRDPALENIAVDTLALAPGGGLWAEGVDYGGVGFDGDASSVFLHFDGTRWLRVSSPVPHGRITSMTMPATGDGWAVGMLPPSTTSEGGTKSTRPYEAGILRYQGGRWQVEARFSPPVGAPGYTPYTFERIVATPDGQIWALGTDGLLASHVRDSWEQLPGVTGASLHDLAFISSREGWAVGDHRALLHYVDGTWHPYP